MLNDICSHPWMICLLEAGHVQITQLGVAQPLMLPEDRPVSFLNPIFYCEL